MAAYAMSKAGAEAFANSLRQEVHHHGVAVGVGVLLVDRHRSGAGCRPHPALAGRRDRLPSFARKTYPVSAVGDAVLEGVEKRARTIVVPGSVKVMKALRGVLWPLAERDSLKQFPEHEATFERDVAERGADAASRPVGAGGEAVTARNARERDGLAPRASCPRSVETRDTSGVLQVLHGGEDLLHGGVASPSSSEVFSL